MFNSSGDANATMRPQIATRNVVVEDLYLLSGNFPEKPPRGAWAVFSTNCHWIEPLEKPCNIDCIVKNYTDAKI